MLVPWKRLARKVWRLVGGKVNDRGYGRGDGGNTNTTDNDGNSASTNNDGVTAKT